MALCSPLAQAPVPAQIAFAHALATLATTLVVKTFALSHRAQRCTGHHKDLPDDPTSRAPARGQPKDSTRDATAREARERESGSRHASHRLAHDARGVHPCCSVCCSVRRRSDDDRAPSEAARVVDAARAGRRLANACGVRTRAAAFAAIARVGQRRRGWRGHAWRPVLDCFSRDVECLCWR